MNIDCHVHSMYSKDALSKPKSIARAAKEHNIVIALTDHNTVAGIDKIRREIEWLTRLEQDKLAGVQHKYRQTALYFPAQGQTCHAYCTYCFRWAQFVGIPDLKFSCSRPDVLVRYLCERGVDAAPLAAPEGSS